MRIDPHDEAALDWFYGEGQSMFERSASGAMLERAWAFKVNWLPDPELFAARLARQPWEPDPGDITAQPTAEVRAPGGTMPNEGAISRYARVSRLVRDVAALDLASAGVLALFYGDQGQRWGRTVHGRLFALYPQTGAGRELLQTAHASRKKEGRPDLGLSAAEQLFVTFEVLAVQPKPVLRALQAKARVQALRAYEQACTLWRQAKEGP